MTYLYTPTINTVYQQATELITQKIRNDEGYPELCWDILCSSPHSDQYGTEVGARFFFTQFVPLPLAIAAQLGEMKYYTFSGLFPEIGRAWITIDNKVFLWNYQDRSEFEVYDELEEIIVVSALVPAKREVFVKEVKYLLVLATSVEIVILAIFLDQDNRNLKIHPTKYALPTDNVYIMKIAGTKKGRIFLSGSDGCLYEFDYALEDGWFQKKSRKINCSSSVLFSLLPGFMKFSTPQPLSDIVIDETRNTLYALSVKSFIEVYDLGENSTSIKHIMTFSNWIHYAQSLCPSLSGSPSYYFDITYITSIPFQESKRISLVAVTKSGLRLYFSSLNQNLKKGLYLEHIRLPPQIPEVFENSRLPSLVSEPREILSGTENRLREEMGSAKVRTAYFCKGVFLCAFFTDGINIQVTGICPSIMENLSYRKIYQYKLRPAKFVENFSSLKHLIEMAVIDIKEIPTSHLTGYNLLPSEERALKNELAVQHNIPPRQFLFLSSGGVQVVSKARPIDDLRDLLQRESPESQNIINFMKQYGIEEFCAMCLALAINSGEVAPASPVRITTSLSSNALQAFFHHGGEIRYTDPRPQSIGRSGCHDGFAIYFSRVISPIWFETMVKLKKNGRAQDWKTVVAEEYTPRFKKDHYFRIENALKALKNFLETNNYAVIQEIRGQEPPPSFSQRLMHLQRPVSVDKLIKEEEVSLSNLHILLNHCIETLAFWRILMENNLADIINRRLDLSIKPTLKRLTFQELVASSEGNMMCKVFANALIESHEDDQEWADSLADALHTQCPTLFSNDDRICIKGNELLVKAKGKLENAERLEYLQQSLNEFLNVPLFIFQQGILERICSDYQHLRFYTAVVELSLACAAVVDPAELGLKWTKAGKLDSDIHGKRMFETRMRCYDNIIRVLNELLMPVIDYSNPQRPTIDPEQFSVAKAQTIKIARRSKDELFHFRFYEWYIEQNISQELVLHLEAPYLETYLKNYCKHPSAPELLWKLYVRNQKFSMATHVLLKLAEDTDTQKTLQERVGLLARAIANAKSAQAQGEPEMNPQTIRDLEDKMEVANIQQKIYQELDKLVDRDLKNKVRSELDAKLYSISEMYNKFAIRYALSESALAILHCAGQCPPELVIKIWKTIIEEALGIEKGHQQLSALRAKLITLGIEYYTNESIFPLDTLIDTLETSSLQCNMSQGWTQTWVVDAMIQIGVPLHTLFSQYTALIKKNEDYWHQNIVHLLGVIVYILFKWTDEVIQPSCAPTEVRQFREAHVDSAISHFLTILQTLRGPDANRLLNNFRVLLDLVHKNNL